MTPVDGNMLTLLESEGTTEELKAFDLDERNTRTDERVVAYFL